MIISHICLGVYDEVLKTVALEVDSVTRGKLAEKGRIKAGDRLVAVDGTPLDVWSGKRGERVDEAQDGSAWDGSSCGGSAFRLRAASAHCFLLRRGGVVASGVEVVLKVAQLNVS